MNGEIRKFGKAALTFLPVLALATHLRAQTSDNAWEFPDLTATQVFHMAKYDMTMKVYRSGSSVRVERSPAITTLYAPASGKVYSLTTYPDGTHQCVVMRTDQAKMLESPLELLYGSKVKRTPAGTEVVEGHTCKVEIADVTRPDGKTIRSKVWEAEDLKGAPVKIESQLPETKLTAIYRDIVLGTPDKALFSPPEKCTPLEKMGQVAEHQENK
ncbi:MAG: hypothetical protein JOY62_12180 [Acidobacteriaceae bacterium]|nr:hypothetical protein [Acidobacteriaceae bacterium]MBV9780717.1 hypothetical protein [Acidobacteriaceae bacterium]